MGARGGLMCHRQAELRPRQVGVAGEGLSGETRAVWGKRRHRERLSWALGKGATGGSLYGLGTTDPGAAHANAHARGTALG